MTPMQDSLEVNLNDDPNNITNDVENTVENPAWCTVENNCKSFIPEDIEKIIKVETDMVGDCMWQSQIDIAEHGDNSCSSLPFNVHQNTSMCNNSLNPKESFLCYKCGLSFALHFELEHHLEIHEELIQNRSSCNGNIYCEIKNPQTFFLCHICGESFIEDFNFRNHIERHNKPQSESDSNSDLNFKNKILLQTFYCNICGECFDQNFDLNNHLKKHEKPAKLKKHLFKCNFCGQKFELNFALNRHIKNYHKSEINNVINVCECTICKNFIDEAEYDEHVKTHKSRIEKDTDFIVNLKLSKLNGVWKSKPNIVYKCNICDEKFQNEIGLTEHMIIHRRNDNQKQSEDGLNISPICRSNDNTQQINDNDHLRCQKCNLQFDKKENLNLHLIYCTKSSRNIWSKFLGAQNIAKVSVVCTVCGISFNSPQLLNNHKNSGCRLHICTFCQMTFNTKELWSKHVDVCRKHNKCESNRNINKSCVNEAQNQNSLKNTSIRNIKKENSQSQQISLRKMSDLLESAANGNQSNIVPSIKVGKVKTLCSNVSEKIHSTVLNAKNCSEIIKETANNSLNIEKDRTLCLNGVQQNSFNIKNTVNTFVTAVQSVQPDLMVSGSCVRVKKEKDLCTAVNEQNSSNQVNSNSFPEPHNVVSYNCSLNIKKEKGISTNIAESNNFDPTDTANSRECTISMLSTTTSNTEIKREPENLESNIVECIEKESNYFTVKKTTFKGNVSSNTNNHNYEQILESNILCACKICSKSFTDVHTLALHMSDHKECNMHECVVCSKTFETVLLWTNHMAFHHQQKNLILSEAHNNPIRNDTIATDTSSFENSFTESQTTKTVDNRKCETYLKIKREFKNSDVSTNSNTNVKQFKSSHLNSSLPHQTISSILKSFSCKYCDRTFSGQGPLTNHEKSHTNPNKILITNIDNTLTTFGQAESNFDLQINNNTLNPVQPIVQPRIRTISLGLKRFVCHYCKKKFTKKCYRTNHMRIVHNKITILKTPKTMKIENRDEINETVNINVGEQSFNSFPKVKSTEDHKNNSFVSGSTDLNKVNVNSKGNVPYCTTCQKKFAHIGALTSHMHIHSNLKPYKCKYCNRKFNMKGPYTLHVRKHNKMVDVDNVQDQNLSQENVEMVEAKDREEELQVESKENINNSESFDHNLNENLNCTKSSKKNRMWFVCDVCDKKFSTPFQIILHRRLLHGTITPYACKICNKSYDVRHRWNRHLKSHYSRNNCIENLKNGLHTNNTKLVGSTLKNHQRQNQFKCGYCKKEYNLIYHWKKHLSLSKECRRHCKNNVPEFTSVQAKNNFNKFIRYECKICKKTYSTDYNRKVHMSNIHHVELGTERNLDIRVQDSLIDKTPSQQKSNISNQNKRSICSFNTPYKCNVCGKFYSNANNLSRHRNLTHLKANVTITCKICKRIFKHKYSYREHCKSKHTFLLQTENGINSNAVISSSSVSLLAAEINNKNIALQNTKKFTKTQNVKGTYKCNDCGQNFETNCTLGEHILENHKVKNTLKVDNEKIVNTPSGSNNDNSVKCNVCLKGFSSMSYLPKHMLLHSGIKPFKCDICNMAFRFKPNLRTHKKVHLTVA